MSAENNFAHIDFTEILTEATRIAGIHLPSNAAHVTNLRDAFVNYFNRDMYRFISSMIDDARDESSDYFTSLPSDVYSRRYDALHSLLTSMLYPVIMTSMIA